MHIFLNKEGGRMFFFNISDVSKGSSKTVEEAITRTLKI
ncbi:Putative uncharacterized protein [Moritella viscosa]|nr:Putative uncharacterized protein [Moritella viscosa]